MFHFKSINILLFNVLKINNKNNVITFFFWVFWYAVAEPAAVTTTTILAENRSSPATLYFWESFLAGNCTSTVD
jgi:hypothetical protein